MRTASGLGIATVAVFSDPDENAPFVQEADEAFRLTGSAPSDTYLSIEKVIEAARATEADAVHPGYGFLSENAKFARACEEGGLVFVGPSAASIDAMGSKIEAKAMMAKAGVPVLPGLVIGGDSTGHELAEGASGVGFPLLVKASFGGGGRGMRVVHALPELAGAIAEAQREAASAFGDETVFLERYIESPRHVEVQIVGDSFGNVVHLFERECSIQRRHQKIIEEAPSPGVDADLRAKICATSVAAAHAIDYVGVGTIEFVVNSEGDFFFLEMNTRIQVEHPITEMVTGLDLVRLQLEIASGGALPTELSHTTINGHAIEARLYAEDVPAGFVPVAGRLDRFQIPKTSGVRVDSGYESGNTVSTFYDSMLAKVVAWAPSRQEAATKLADTLARVTVHGVVTNRDLLVQTLRTEDFLQGHTDTGFYERHDPTTLGRPAHHKDAPRLHPFAVAAYRIAHGGRCGPQPSALPPSWRNVGGGTASLFFEIDGEEIEIPGRVAEFPEGLTVGDVGPDSVVLYHDNVRREYQLENVGMAWYVDSSLGSTTVREIPRFAVATSTALVGSLVAPLPGTVITVVVLVGNCVEEGDLVVTLEAMKMEHAVRAPYAGRVEEVRVAPGDQVDAGDVLVVVESSDGDAVSEEP
jgi:acetyl/propionyl-CoA carboxylase alpha subunit